LLASLWQSRSDNIHEIKVATKLDAGVNLLLGLVNSIGDNSALILSTLLARLDSAVHTINARRNSLVLAMRVGMRITMSMGMIMTSSTRSNSKTLIHRDKGHETNQDAQSQNKVTVRLDKHELDSLIMVFTNENLGKQMEQGITEKASHSKSNHNRQRGGIDVGRANSEEEVGRTGDVEGREEGVDGGRTGEENGEGTSC